MFESDFIDLFSRTPWTIVPILFVPGAAFLFWGSLHYAGLGVLLTLALTAGGFVFWTFSEYWLHRLFFHWEPPGKWGERMHFLVHGVHHKWPKTAFHGLRIQHTGDGESEIREIYEAPPSESGSEE